MGKKEAIAKVKWIIDSYIDTLLPADLAQDIRDWFLADERHDEKVWELYTHWKRKVRPNLQPSELTDISFEKIAEKLDFPKSVEEGFRMLDANIPLLEMRSEDDDVEEFGRAESAAAPRKGYTIPLRRNLARIAVAASLMIFIGGAAYFLLQRPQPITPMTAMVTIAVPDTLGAQGRTDLMDGSEVFIRPGSSISYAEDFESGDKRRVTMSGEAYFEVAKDSIHPFVVEAGELTVNVLGTRFNVVASPGNAQTLVTLYEGRVTVDGIMGGDGQTVIDITPGQRLVYDNATGRYVIEQVTARVPDWIAQRLTFDNTPLSDIFRAIEWYYGVKVETDGKLDTGTEYTFRFSGRENLTLVLTLLETITLKMKCSVDGKTVKVTAI